MKNLALVALVLVSGMSQARSLAPNVRLQAVQKSFVDFHHLPVGEGQALVVTVDGKGVVQGAECTEKLDTTLGVGRTYYVDCKKVEQIEKLSRSEMHNLENLIRDARLGEIVFPDPFGLRCLAMPTHSSSFKADNGSVFLSAGTYPCGTRTYNKSEAAKLLVETLNGYVAKYSQRIGSLE